MSLLLSRLRFGTPALVRSKSSLLLLFSSKGFSTCMPPTSPSFSFGANRYRDKERGTLKSFIYQTGYYFYWQKSIPLELVDSKPMITIGASHGWIATLKGDGILRLQDDLNPFASDTDPKRIPLPPLVTLPGCQTQIVTNVSMSSSSPDTDEDCIVAVKFLGPHLSFCRPASSAQWINIRIKNPCFLSSRVMFSEKDNMFRIPGSGGHLIGSWDLTKQHKHKIQRVRFRNLPKLTKAKRELLHSCSTSEHLVESRTTGETFMIKWYRKAGKGLMKMKTKALMVFKLDEEGNAVYTQDIGDLFILLSKSEPFCVPSSIFPRQEGNLVVFVDVDEYGEVCLNESSIKSLCCTIPTPYLIPPQE